MRTRSIIAVLAPSSTAVDWMVALFVALLAAACSDGSGTGGSPSDAAADAADTASTADTSTADTGTADAGTADTAVEDTAVGDTTTDDAVDGAGDVTDVADTAQADTEPADTKVPFPNACVCTNAACGSGAIGGDQGDVFTDVSDDAVAKSFKPHDATGWTCVVPTVIQVGLTGPLACFCAKSCGNGGAGGDPGSIHTGLEQADVEKTYGGGKPDNATGWLCGKNRGDYGQ